MHYVELGFGVLLLLVLLYWVGAWFVWVFLILVVAPIKLLWRGASERTRDEDRSQSQTTWGHEDASR